jgi:hypothetical protein
MMMMMMMYDYDVGVNRITKSGLEKLVLHKKYRDQPRKAYVKGRHILTA